MKLEGRKEADDTMGHPFCGLGQGVVLCHFGIWENIKPPN
jgi:hypothetical protein